MMLSTFLVILPPLLVIACVLLTRRMIPAFLLGIISSALIVSKGNPLEAVKLSATKLWQSSGLNALTSVQSFLSSWNMLIFLFLIMVGILIALLSKTGAAQAYVTLAQKYVRSKKATEIASLLLSLLFFIDDYFSALTVGSVMRPLAHLYKVHPVKLAFLTTAMATPLTILSPLSSWLGEIILQIKQIGIGPSSPQTLIIADPYMLFLHTIPLILYALLLIISTWYIVLRGIVYGPMVKYDRNCDKTSYCTVNAPSISQTALDAHTLLEQQLNDQLQTSGETTSHANSLLPHETAQQKHPHASLFDFLLPIVSLMIVVFIMMLYTGNYWLCGGSCTFMQALQNAAVHQALFTGGIVSLTISSLYYLYKRRIDAQDLIHCIKEGFNLMFPSLLMLVCAWALGSLLKNDLKTGAVLASLLSGLVTPYFLPAVCFLFATCIAWMIGSAWATIGLMFPIIIDMLQKIMHITSNTPFDAVPLLIPVLGATLSGCVMGTQLSLISDNPIMSAASTGADHLEHVKTMAWYIIPVGIATALTFTLIGIILPVVGIQKTLLIGIVSGIALSLIFLEIAYYLFGKRGSLK